MKSEENMNENFFQEWEKDRKRGRICTGILVIAAAILFFLKENGTVIPGWVFTWPMILIGVGIVSAVKHRFRGAFWMILILIGIFFLFDQIIPDLSFEKYQVPLILLVIGLVLIFKPRRKHRYFNHGRYYHHQKRSIAASSEMQDSHEDFLKVDNLFSGTKKNIISKQFKGGEIRNVFGGCEINLMQADFDEKATIDIQQQFGGVKLIVPSSWIVKSDLVCILAGIEDHRQNARSNENKTKTLYLKGQVVLGGVEIDSY